MDFSVDFKDKNYYEVLEVPLNASSEEIYQGYVRAKNAYAQESLAFYSLMTKEECDKLMVLIEEAYSIISDPKKRRLYDEARGIKTKHSSHNNTQNSSSNSIQLRDERSALVDGPGSMTKLVAKQKFALVFQQNSNFEQEIESTTEFTGEFLKSIREYKNVDLNRMTEMTKVSKTYLRYIEEEAVDKLPALVYVRGFVYQYAKCLKLNPDLVATSYLYRLKKLKGERD